MDNILLRIRLIGNDAVVSQFEQVKRQLGENTALLNKYNRVISEYQARQEAGITATTRQTTAYNQAVQMVDSLTTANTELKTKYDSLNGAIQSEIDAYKKETAYQSQAQSTGERLKSTIEGETSARGRNLNQIRENQAGINALNQTKRLEAKITSEQVGAYDKLLASYDLAKKELLDLAASGITSGEAFDSAKMKAATYEQTLNNLHRTTAQYGTQANDAYYSTFQLTQVMRELPNFAISSRIGLMSISNNLPGLVDGFKNLANSVDETGKKLGNVGALKAFGKSLMSFNTILIAGTTLMLALGNEKTMAWVKGFVGGKEKTDALTTSIKTLNKSIKDSGSEMDSAIKKQLELGIVLGKAEDGVISSDTAVKMYNETLGTHYGKVTNVNEAIKGYAKYSEDFIIATMNQMAALQLMDSASDKIQQNQLIKTKNQRLSNYNELQALYNETYKYASENYTHGLKLLNNEIEVFSKRGYFASKKWLTENAIFSKQITKILSIDGGEAFLKNQLAIAKNEAAIRSVTKTATELIGKSKDLYNEIGGDKTTTKVNKTTETYNAQAAALHEIQIELENLATKEEQFGIRNPYEKRLEAAEAWRKNQTLINEEERDDQIQAVKESTDIEKNKTISLKKINDDFSQKEQDAERKRKEWIYNIRQDELDFKKQNISKELADKLQTLEDERNAEEQAEDERFKNQKFTKKNKEQLEKDHRINLLKIEADYNKKARQAEITTLEDSLSLANLSQSEIEDINAQINKKKLDDAKKTADELHKIEEEQTKKSIALTKLSEDDKNRIKGEAINTAQTLLNSYYDYLFDKIDKEYDKTVESLDKTKYEQEKSLEKRHKDGLLSDEQYEMEKERISTEYEAKKQEADKVAFEKEKQVKVRQAWMEYALGLVKIWSESGINAILAGILSGFLTATTLTNVALINKQQYATGGKAVISNIPRQTNGDNVLATIKTGEVVLTEDQQAKLGGDRTFAAIGVPGFASGGLVRPYIPSVISKSDSMMSIVKDYIDSSIRNIRVTVLESDITTSQMNKESKTIRTKIL
jgi:hypothetical protein